MISVKKKNITFISLNFAPEDSAIGLYSSQWVKHLDSNGHKITVVTAFPYYPQWEIIDKYKNKPRFFHEYIGKTKLLRYKQYVPKNPSFLKRIFHIIDFTVGSFFNLLKIKECDLVIAVIPFTTSAALGWFQKTRFSSKLWIHIQDFEFDAAHHWAGKPRVNFVFSLLFKLESWLFRKSNIVSTISHSMTVKLSKKSKTPSFYLPNWVDPNKINPETSKPHLYTESDKIVLLYSGNIGDKQDWQIFIEFCEDIDQNRYEVIIVGEGAKKEWLVEKTARFSNVKHYPPVPYRDLSDLLCSADIHLLFQKPEFLDSVMPSKVLGMMASTKPSFIIGHKDSEINIIFNSIDIGVCFDAYSKEVAEQLYKLTNDTSRMEEMGKNARSYVLEHFSKEKVLNNVLKKIDLL